ncbi:carbohydrate ABC transporter permease [Spiroplasma endosymbiont of Agriotes lineatus]|uniref:carbohydrate ABC transporter permease n=1 Tax=Spiroplasma endosymbiont of Agriotes lineatus TaxID=3077930 RepID=UPI0030D0E8B4
MNNFGKKINELLKMHCNKIGLWFKTWVSHQNVVRKTNFTQQMAGNKGWKKWISIAIRFLFLLVMAIIVVFPFYWMIITSFKTDDDLDPTKPQGLWPEIWTFKWYTYLLENSQINVGKYLFNSFLVAFLSTIFKLFICALAGFALAHYQTKFREAIFILLLSTLMIPGEAIMIGQYLLILRIVWDDTAEALVIPFIASAFTIFMLRQAFEGIPKSIVSASKIDGLSTFKFFWKVALPLVQPVLWTAGLISFIASWNAVLWPVTVLDADSKWATLPMLLWELIQVTEPGPNNPSMLRDPQHLKMASAVISILPMIVLYLLTKKRIINSVTKDGSGTKG